MLMNSMREPEMGVVEVFRLKQPLPGSAFPLIFKVVTKPNAPEVFMKYNDLKRDFPELLFEYFQRKLHIGPLKGDSHCQTPDRRDRIGVAIDKDSTRDREQGSGRDREDENARGARDRRRGITQKEKERQPVNLVRRRDTRPVRACRKNLAYNKPGDHDFREQANHLPIPISIPPLPAALAQTPSSSVSQEVESSSQESQLDSTEQFMRKAERKILDYDQMIEEQSVFNLISPAVIPAMKGKERPHAPGTYYPPLPPLTPIKEPVLDREFSSEGFKDSEESEFLIEDKPGRERRRKERFMNARQMEARRKKTKPIKKSNKKMSHK